MTHLVGLDKTCYWLVGWFITAKVIIKLEAGTIFYSCVNGLVVVMQVYVSDPRKGKIFYLI